MELLIAFLCQIPIWTIFTILWNTKYLQRLQRYKFLIMGSIFVGKQNVWENPFHFDNFENVDFHNSDFPKIHYYPNGVGETWETLY